MINGCLRVLFWISRHLRGFNYRNQPESQSGLHNFYFFHVGLFGVFICLITLADSQLSAKLLIYVNGLPLDRTLVPFLLLTGTTYGRHNYDAKIVISRYSSKALNGVSLAHDGSK